MTARSNWCAILQVGVSELLPVMVFLHGGGYQGGGAYQYEPHVLLDHQVVLVVPQFRVAALGEDVLRTVCFPR